MKKFVRRYLSANVLPIWMILAMDVVMIGLSLLLAYALRYDFSSRVLDSATMWRTMGLTMVVSLVIFKMFRTYSSVLRLSSFVDIARIFVALFVSYTTVALACMVAPLVTDIRLAPVNVILMAFIINFALMASSRVIVKMMFETIKAGGSSQTNIFIYGAKEAGVNIAKSLRVSMRERYRLRGFIADEPDLYDKLIMGVRVFPNDENLFDILAQKGVKTIIVSPAKRNELKKEENLDRFLKHNIKLLTAPPLSEWNQRGLESGDIKEIQIEDLLQRDPIQIDIRKVASHLEGKRVMITGAAGSIGSEIMRQVATFNPYKLILVDQAETPLHDIRLELMDKWRNLDAETIVADIANQTRMEAIFKEFRPQYIFHAAAYKHVPMMEDNVSESIQTNVAGTRILADLAVKYKAEKFVMISTDKAVNPTNVMGCSKRICEIYVQSLAKKLQKEGEHVTQFITTRFGNVLGSNGSVIPRFKDQIRRGGPVTVTHPEIIRYFMTIPEACRLVLEAGSMGNGGEIYIFDMGKPVKIVDLAKRMISLSGRTDVKIEFTGLRHGEKLYEELLNVKELTKPTYHEKIMIATVREYDYDEVKDRIQHLIDVSYSYDQMKIVAAMKDLVPEFISKNSCFEALDKKEE
ncbi:polysaccharide biosynthesis protein [Bacteroides sp. AN502]|nr:polysaccharide biosynthesis protein [Caecibacteroides pullorum]MDC6281712.1 nucleoside-diphosphate sugar epimerase/dehydratase [Caecibacteroides pullorum]